MNSFKIAYKLLTNNLRIYGLYVIVLVVTVATYYNFVAIQYNDTFVQLTQRLQSAVVASMTSGFVLMCTVVFFMWHANGFFFKQRQKETGIYMLMGISSSKIGRVFAIESMLLGGLSMVVGLTVGVMFSKLFFMLLGKAMSLEVEIPFTISFKAMIQLVIVFGLIFALLGRKNYNEVKKSRLIDMIHATKAKPAVPQLNYVKGILGVVCIAVGYLVALTFLRWNLDLLFAAMTTLVLVSAGTYFFFGSCLTIMFKKLLKSKQMVYKDVRLVSISNLFFRLKANYRSLAMTAILAAATVTAFSISLAFKQYAEDHKLIEAPYSITYASSDPDIKDKVRQAIEATDHQLIGWNELRLLPIKTEYASHIRIDPQNEAILISYSQLQRTLEFLEYKNFEKLLREMEPQSNEIVFLFSARTMASPVRVHGEEVKINGEPYRVKEARQVPITGNVDRFGNKNIYVLPDKDYTKLQTNHDETLLHGIRISDQENSEALVQSLAAIVPGGKVNGSINQYVQEYYALGTFFFLGSIMSIVFMMATFSTIYFKILSDAFTDKEQYTILKKIGMSEAEVGRSVYMQVGIAFILPVLVGIAHSMVAMSMLEVIMSVQFVTQMLYSIGIFVVVMIAFYVGLSKNYTRMVYTEASRT
ncbi:ABC transporter permease [Paenibacillus puerhi]|uniref:ABC transporter permease n=1 Tax=Paenibacillus puerhi TaxID=2692622 RepID=UPI0013573725|nr:ABC transporter permease [Paenibacillus puerhi]